MLVAQKYPIERNVNPKLNVLIALQTMQQSEMTSQNAKTYRQKNIISKLH